MSETKSNKKMVGWLIVIGLIAFLFGVGIYIGNKKSDETPAAETSGETVLDPQAGDLTPPDKTAEPTEPEDVIAAQTASVPGLEIGMSSAEVENLLEERFTPETSEGNQSFNMRLTPQTANGYSLIAVVENMMDDSVKSQEITAMFRPGARDNFVLSEYNVRVQCRRGSNAGNWQTQACP